MLFSTAPNATQVQCKKKKQPLRSCYFPPTLSHLFQSLVATVFQIIPEHRRLRTDQKNRGTRVLFRYSLRLSKERLYNEINVLVYIYFFSTNAPYIALDR